MKLPLSDAVLARVVAVCTIIYCGATLFMYWELKEANSLTILEQEQTLRPFVIVEGAYTDYTKKDDLGNELWTITLMVRNGGDLPSSNTEMHGYIDGHKDILISEKPQDLNIFTLSPILGTVAFDVKSTKNEAMRFDACYLHVLIWYKGQENREFKSAHTYRLDYEPGDHLDWISVFADVE
ncbi:hypothetical protein ACFL67_01470 [candidate division KSB1 bacterium]